MLERRKEALVCEIGSVRGKSVWPSGKDPTCAGSFRFPMVLVGGGTANAVLLTGQTFAICPAWPQYSQRLFARRRSFSASVRGPRVLLASFCIGTGPDGMEVAAGVGKLVLVTAGRAMVSVFLAALV